MFGKSKDPGYSGHVSFAERDEINRREKMGRSDGARQKESKERPGRDRIGERGERHVRVHASEGGGYRTTTHQGDDGEPENEMEHETKREMAQHVAGELGQDGEEEGNDAGGDGMQDSGGEIAGTL